MKIQPCLWYGIECIRKGLRGICIVDVWWSWNGRAKPGRRAIVHLGENNKSPSLWIIVLLPSWCTWHLQQWAQTICSEINIWLIYYECKHNLWMTVPQILTGSCTISCSLWLVGYKNWNCFPVGHSSNGMRLVERNAIQSFLHNKQQQNITYLSSWSPPAITVEMIEALHVMGQWTHWKVTTDRDWDKDMKDETLKADSLVSLPGVMRMNMDWFIYILHIEWQ